MGVSTHSLGRFSFLQTLFTLIAYSRAMLALVSVAVWLPIIFSICIPAVIRDAESLVWWGRLGVSVLFWFFLSFFSFKGVRAIFFWQLASWTSTAIPWRQLAQNPRPFVLNWGVCGHVVVTGNVHKEAALSHALLWILGASGPLGPAGLLGCAINEWDVPEQRRRPESHSFPLQHLTNSKSRRVPSGLTVHCWEFLGVRRLHSQAGGWNWDPQHQERERLPEIISDMQMTARLWQKVKKN